MKANSKWTLIVALTILLTGCATDKFASPTKLVSSGWKASWSPDSRKLVYGKMEGGGLEVFDLASGQAKTLLAKAKDAAWSPDGRWIAFVREVSFNQYLTEEVWVIPAQGGEPQRLVRGGFPSWSSDGRRLFVHSRHTGDILAVNLSDPAAQPVQFFTKAPSWYFAVSPDETRVAFGCGGRLDIRDRVTGKTLAEWPTPGERGLLPAWSPDGRLVAFGGFDDSQLGLWVFEPRTGRAERVIEGCCTMPAWSANGRLLAFDERTDPWSIWVAGRHYIDGLFKGNPTQSTIPPAKNR